MIAVTAIAIVARLMSPSDLNIAEATPEYTMESIKIEQDEILRIIRENLQLKMSVDEDLGCLYVPLHNKNVCVVGYVEGKEKIDLLKGWLQ